MADQADELDEVAGYLRACGLGEGTDFYVEGQTVPGGLSSEFIGLGRLDDGTYRVWYVGDRGSERTCVGTADFAEARTVFVREAVTLARGRWGSSIREPRPSRWPWAGRR